MKTSKDPRHLARKIALLTLFQWSSRPDLYENKKFNVSEALESIAAGISDELEGSNPKISMAKTIVKGVIADQTKIDEIITKCAPEWPLEQIAKVDVNILRMATFELLNSEGTPIKVAIDEAVELAKEYGSDASSKFVNGVLGTVVKEYVDDTKAESSS